METILLWYILAISSHYNVDPALSAAIIHTESKFNPKAIGSLGEVGLMQVRPEHVPQERHHLIDPVTNILVGVKILSNAKAKCKYKVDKAFVVCYNAGIKGGSRLTDPKSFPYYKKVYKRYLKYKKEGIVWK